jgi:hypothetical protein
VIAHQDGAARLDEGFGVVCLLVVLVVRERHEHCRQADHGELGHGACASARHGQVGGGVRLVHAVDVPHQLDQVAARMVFELGGDRLVVPGTGLEHDAHVVATGPTFCQSERQLVQ